MRIYSEIGSEPEQIVTHISSFLSVPARILDLGAGDGRHSIYLAAQGFDVLAVDSDPEVIRSLEQKAQSLNLSGQLTTQVASLESFAFPELSGAIVFSFILHLLPVHVAQDLIRLAQKNTKIGGIHVGIVITDESDFCRMDSGNNHYFPHPDALKNLYNGWDMKLFEIEASDAHDTHIAETVSMNTFISFLAQKNT